MEMNSELTMGLIREQRIKSEVKTHRLHVCTASVTALRIESSLTQQPGLMTRPEAPRAALLAADQKNHMKSSNHYCLTCNTLSSCQGLVCYSLILKLKGRSGLVCVYIQEQHTQNKMLCSSSC